MTGEIPGDRGSDIKFEGTWLELESSANHAGQVRSVALVTKAVALGALSKKNQGRGESHGQGNGRATRKFCC